MTLSFSELEHPRNQHQRILLVEDKPDHAELIAMLLQREYGAISTAIATTVKEAMETIESFSPTLVLSDYRLGTTSCFDLLNQMRQYESSIPVIILTGQGDEQVAAEAIGRGAFDYLIKDQVFNNFAELKKSIESVLQRAYLQEALQESEELYRTLVDNILDGVFILRLGRLAFFNPALDLMLAGDLDSHRKRPFVELFEKSEVDRVSRAIDAAAGGRAQQGRFVLRHAETAPPVHADITFNQVSYAGETAVIGTVRDVTLEVETEARLKQALKDKEKLSITDELTGLFNRRHAFSVLADEVERSKRYEHSLSIIMFDVDNFKLINDKHGHLAGDEALRTVSRRLSRQLRQNDVACRYGGDEFLIILPHTAAGQAGDLAERIRSSVNSSTIADTRLSISCGVAELTGEYPDDEGLIHCADLAMLAAKNQGKNRVVVAGDGG